jgi:hypothetical protein
MLAGSFQRQLVNFWPLSLKKLYSDINDMEFKVIVKILCVNNLKTIDTTQYENTFFPQHHFKLSFCKKAEGFTYLKPPTSTTN